MIKKRYVLSGAVFAALAYVYFPSTPHIVVNNGTADEKNSAEQLVDEETLEFSDRVFATQKLKELTISNAQCKSKQTNFSGKVRNILSILTNTLENELRNGVSERELLAYDEQFPTFYKGFEDVLIDAMLNIEREKYQTTPSIEILNLWSGLNVLNGFNAINVPLIVEASSTLDLANAGFSMNLELNPELDTDDVLALLDNTEHFNTRLNSPFRINGVQLSPSVLFVTTATTLDVETYENAVSLQSFNVNDVAVAIQNDMPIEYLKPLLAQTLNIEDMPTLYQNDYDAYRNLADIATANHNVEALKELSRFGVNPTNEPGIITGLDIALKFLPSKPEDYTAMDVVPKKYLDTLNYLIEKGYQAHGYQMEIANGTLPVFSAPNSRHVLIENVADAKLQSRMADILLIDKSELIVQIESDDSLISNAIETIEIKKQALNATNTQCDEIRRALEREEGFADGNEKYTLLDSLAREEDGAQRLHDIDPALVDLLDSPSGRTGNSARINSSSEFVELLYEQDYEQALYYSASEPLTEYETGQLLYFLSAEPEKFYPIWRARVSHTPPSGLMSFKRIPIKHWRYLLNEGFNFSQQDIWGNDFFAPASLHSKEAVALLLDHGFKPNFDNLGLDPIDLALEDSYKKGELNESVVLLLDETKTLEPNYFSRIARLKRFFPAVYEQLIELDKRYIPPEQFEPNRYRSI